MDDYQQKHVSQSSPNWRYAITDLIPKEKLQKIQDAFAIANQVASTITDADGVPITTPSNHCAVCRMIRATPKGLANCITSGKSLGSIARKQQRPVHRVCLSVGFTDAVAPIVVNGVHIANWNMGQYFTSQVDEQRIREYALEISADPEQMVHEFQTMPKLSQKEFESKLDFLEIMANELSLMGYLHLQQKEQTAELHQIRAELELHQTQLERNVEERTKDLQKSNQLLQREISQKSKNQRRQNRLFTAIQSAGESIVITSPNGRIIYVNPAFEKLTGFSVQEVIGKSPKILQSGYHDSAFYTSFWETIRSGQIWQGRFINKKKDGSIYQEDATISPIMDKNGKIINYVAVKRDVTREHQLHEQLKQAQRLETIGTLAAGVAHEINTPIQYLLTNTHFLQDVLKDLITMQGLYQQLMDGAAATLSPLVEPIMAMAEEIELDYLMKESEQAIMQSLDGLNKIADIVKAMKDFADPGSTSKQPDDLNTLIKSTVDVSINIWDNVAEIELDLDKSLPHIPIYAGKLKQILLDMLINSTHALIEKHGMSPHNKGRITIATHSRKDHVELIITDTGAGIPKEILPRIFDPFFSTKTVGEGEGQSLTIAHRVIVENHGGSIKVESQPQQGTTFTICLPMLDVS